jgi:predicted Zn-dependent protease
MLPRPHGPNLHRPLVIALFTSAIISCSGCADFVKRDAVTGRGTINRFSEEDEIRIGESFAQNLRSQCDEKGIPFDSPGEHLALIQTLGKRIVTISHRPHLPWEFHLVATADVNACAVPGGKVFVFAGLFGSLVTSQEELAAVLGHELAHVTARHTAERLSREQLAPIVSKSAGSQFYKASFSTRQEDEADRIGLLYMALAGFDPAVAPKIWHRAHERYGSNPGSYLYDHSLHADRARKVEALVPIARQYYKGPGEVNQNWKSILAKNDLIDGSDTTDELGAALEAFADAYGEHRQTRVEAKAREKAARIQAVKDRVRIANLKIERTADGKAGVFVDVTNGSNIEIRQITLTIHYLDRGGNTLYSESIRAGPIAPGRSIRPGFYQKSVRGSERVNVVGTDLTID